jgi:hypothetical protein
MDKPANDKTHAEAKGDGAAPLIDSRASFEAALRWGFDAAFAQGARRIVCVAPNWEHWQLWNDASLLPALAAWLRLPQRRLVLLARSYDLLERRCPRFNTWRADWMHAIEAWQPPEELAPELPTVLASEGGANAVSVQLIDAPHWRGRAEFDVRRARQWCEAFDVVLQRSERTWAARPLGL